VRPLRRGTGLGFLIAEARAAVHHGPQAVETVETLETIGAARRMGCVVQQRTEVVQCEGIAATLKNRQLQFTSESQNIRKSNKHREN